MGRRPGKNRQSVRKQRIKGRWKELARTRQSRMRLKSGRSLAQAAGEQRAEHQITVESKAGKTGVKSFKM